MSQENVEIVRRVMTVFGETQQLSELVSPDFVWHVGSWSAWAGEPEFRGREAFMEFFAEWTGAYDEWTLEFDAVDASNSQVVVTAFQRARLWGSDAWVDARAAFVYTVENGLVLRGDVYATLEEALETAGLKE
jgi:ketosteroid isomerase-like protein